MLDIGSIHRREYEFETSRFASPAVAGRVVRGESKAAMVIAQAPGRLHLLGEHGDPGGGLYLSAAIDRYIKVAISARRDNSLRFYAADLNERKRATLANLKYKREDRWANYLKVAIHIFTDLGFSLKGLDFTVVGDIPQQIGLASSSAIEVAAAVALRGFLHAKIGNMEMVKRLTATHKLFFGKKANPVDYLIGFSAKKDQFMVVDELNLDVAMIKSPLVQSKFILIDSRVPRLGIDTELEARKSDLKAALEILTRGREGASFREFAAMDLMESMGNLPEEIRRRSMHVVQEIYRIMEAKEYLLCSDLQGFARLIYHSHESVRDLYEVSCPEIDWIVKRAQETPGVLGSRMTGQGFGGCTYSIVKTEAMHEYRNKIDDYERIFGFHPAIYEVKLGTGSKIISEQ